MSVSANILKRMEEGYQPLALLTTALVLGSLTYSFWNFASGRVEMDAQARFEARMEQVGLAIHGRMIDYEQVLRGCAGLFATSGSVGRSEWVAYVETLRVTENYPGIQGLGFAQRVTAAGKPEHEAFIRAQGFPGYAIRPAGERAEYVPAIYLEPFTGRNMRAFGFDMLSEPERRATLLRARDTADISISNKLTLVQEPERDAQAGFIMVLPVYPRNTDLSRQENRRAKLAGYVYSPFRADDLMRAILGDLRDVRVRIYDRAGDDEESLLYDSHKTPVASGAPEYTAVDSVSVRGHTWLLRVTSLPAFESSIDRSEPWTVLASGIAISLLLLAIIWSLATLRAHSLTLAHRMTNELRESREQLSLALEGSDLAFFDWHIGTGAVVLSARWAEMLGEAPRPTTTTMDALSSLVHPDDLARLRQLLRAMLGGVSESYEMELRVRDSRREWLWILLRGKVTERNVAGKPLRVTGTNANITQRKMVERMKEEFVSTVNHELRTPLTVIIGSLAMLKESLTGIPPDQAMMLDMACQNSARLKALVNDILDLEKVVLGVMQFRMEAVPLGPFLQQALELNRVYADRFKVRYELHGPMPAVALAADRERLLQVMTNLLSNAAKFSPEGDAVVVKAAADGNVARVSVSDNGSGIPEEFRHRIFGKFAQADGSNTRHQEGTGLGLAISKSIIEHMGGRIGFDSEPGRGATFYFELPCTADAEHG